MADDGTQAQPPALDAGLREQVWLRSVVYWFGAGVAVLHLVMNFTTLFSTQWQSTLHFVGLGILAFLLYPPRRAEGAARSRSLLLIDLALCALFVLATLLVVWAEDAIYARGTDPSARRTLR